MFVLREKTIEHNANLCIKNKDMISRILFTSQFFLI